MNKFIAGAMVLWKIDFALKVDPPAENAKAL